MDDKEFVKDFEEKVRKDLIEFLQKNDALDPHVPECPDVEERWSEIAREYMPDGVREFGEYPVASLGWIMFVGMAMAYYWDTDWEKYSKETDLYTKIRDIRGFDHLDEAVVENILGYSGETAEKVSQQVSDCAARVYGILSHEHIEPGTSAAMGCYIAALHQLYLAGMAMELNALGYHMTPLNSK